MKFELRDRVWVMDTNQPVQKYIFARIESVDLGTPKQMEFFYQVVDDLTGAGWGNNEGYRYDEGFLFATRQELLDSL